MISQDLGFTGMGYERVDRSVAVARHSNARVLNVTLLLLHLLYYDTRQRGGMLICYLSYLY
jgi:hypothetical protein